MSELFLTALDLWTLLTLVQLTPFVTKQAEPKRTEYTKKIERNGKTFTVIDSMKGHDYLQLWAERNGEEVYQHAMREYNEKHEYREENNTQPEGGQ